MFDVIHIILDLTLIILFLVLITVITTHERRRRREITNMYNARWLWIRSHPPANRVHYTADELEKMRKDLKHDN